MLHPRFRSAARLAVLAVAVLACSLPMEPARAEVVGATLYPGAALVTETADVPLRQDGRHSTGVLVLPAHAEPGTLSIAAPAGSGLTLAGTTVQSVKRLDRGRIKELTERLEKERAARRALADKLAAREGAAAFWRAQSGAALDKTAEAEAMAAALRRGLGEELAAASALSHELKRQDERIKELEEELDRLTGGAETVHEVTAAFTGPAAASAALTYSYRLRGAGWQPAYVLNALPAKGLVHFSWDALVWQSSGADWTDVPLRLATAEFRTGAEPPALRPWELTPAQPPQAMPRKAERFNAPQAMLMDAAETAASGAPRTKGTVFDTYDLGRVGLPSGDRRRLAVARETWTARFDHLVRPHAEPRAYLRASLDLDATPRYPVGRADFLLEGALVQKLPFTLAEREAELFFGADPQVAVDVKRLEDASGESGFFGSSNKHVWNWRVEVENGKQAPIDLRIEDRLPVPGDERIEIKRMAPDADIREDDALAVWEITLPPGGTRTVDYGYEVKWPGDMDVDLGGR